MSHPLHPQGSPSQSRLAPAEPRAGTSSSLSSSTLNPPPAPSTTGSHRAPWHEHTANSSHDVSHSDQHGPSSSTSTSARAYAPSPSSSSSPRQAAFNSFTSSRRYLSRSPSPSPSPARSSPFSTSPTRAPPSGIETDASFGLSDPPWSAASTSRLQDHDSSRLPYLSLRPNYEGADSVGSPSRLKMPNTAPLLGQRGEKKVKKRPLPLDLSRGSVVGVDPELQAHMDEVASASALSGKSNDTTLSNEMNDLSLLRNTIRQNLKDRPLDSPIAYSDSEPSPVPLGMDHGPPGHSISIAEVTRLQRSDSPHIILDCRSPLAYQQSHLDGAVSVSAPTLIIKRLKKGLGTRPTWATVGSFLDPEGRQLWDTLPRDAVVVLIGENGRDEVARTLRNVVADIGGTARVLDGNWQALTTRPIVGSVLGSPHVTEPSVFIAPPTPPTISAPRLANQQSLPSLRARRAADQSKLPKLSLNVNAREPPRSATLGAFDRRPMRSPGLLSIDTTVGPSKTSGSLSARPSLTQLRSPLPSPNAPGSARPAIAPFLVSTIIPGFLYLGPEILDPSEVSQLKKIGIKRILNMALECDDELGLNDTFGYYKVPMRDIVEETGLAQGITDAMAFLDNARLLDCPTYVHCKAGKSRSVTIVLAYLIHANAWTLKTAYDYVAERRPGISPNIGFVAELMQYAHRELGLRPARGDDTSGVDKAATRPRARDSMPPAWGGKSGRARLNPGGPSGLGEGAEEDRRVDEREIRRGGQWITRRRAPKDSTMRPSRRASKAGLESFASTSTMSTRAPSPRPVSSMGAVSVTPTREGRLNWI